MWGDPGKRQQGKDPGGYQGPAREGRALAHSSPVPIRSENINTGRTGLAGRLAGRETECAGGGGRAGAGTRSPRVDPGAAAGLSAFSRGHLSGAGSSPQRHRVACTDTAPSTLRPSSSKPASLTPATKPPPCIQQTSVRRLEASALCFLTVPRAASAQSAAAARRSMRSSTALRGPGQEGMV